MSDTQKLSDKMCPHCEPLTPEQIARELYRRIVNPRTGDFTHRVPSRGEVTDAIRTYGQREREAGRAEERERCMRLAESAKLPANYQWGHDAMESFNFGKKCAAAAIRAAEEKP